VYSFCPVAHERDIPLPADLAFLVAGSGVAAEKTRDALELYNRVSQRARRLVSLWNEAEQTQTTCLRQIVDSRPDAVAVLRQIAANHDTEWDLGPRLEQFLLESNTFIPAATKAIASGNWDWLRQIVNDSQRHAETDLHNQVPQTIALQRALLDSGALAASAFGAGFGGSVWGLYRTVDMPRAMKQLEGHFEFFATRPGIPAVEL
jgi:galactokinase